LSLELKLSSLLQMRKANVTLPGSEKPIVMEIPQIALRTVTANFTVVRDMTVLLPVLEDAAEAAARRKFVRSYFKTSVARASGLRFGQCSLGKRQRDACATLFKKSSRLFSSLFNSSARHASQGENPSRGVPSTWLLLECVV
jgi:hypothetical protein